MRASGARKGAEKWCVFGVFWGCRAGFGGWSPGCSPQNGWHGGVGVPGCQCSSSEARRHRTRGTVGPGTARHGQNTHVHVCVRPGSRKDTGSSLLQGRTTDGPRDRLCLGTFSFSGYPGPGQQACPSVCRGRGQLYAQATCLEKGAREALALEACEAGNFSKACTFPDCLWGLLRELCNDSDNVVFLRPPGEAEAQIMWMLKQEQVPASVRLQ